MFSLIVPTRQRTRQLGHMLHSLVRTAAECRAIEVILVIDADDRESLAFTFPRINLKRVVVEPGLSMGALNMAGYETATGPYLMLLNDDVVARTPKWDKKIARCLREYTDGIVLIHVNDGVFRDQLCTFPIVSRTFCSLAGHICPREYLRYRIDDHIEDVFNLLGVLGERRSIYLPDVVFEHANFVENDRGVKQYFSNQDILSLDAPRFEALLPARKELALRLKKHLVPHALPAEIESWRQRLAMVRDSFSLRIPGRQRVAAGAKYRWHCRALNIITRLGAIVERIRACLRHKGMGGLVRALWKRAFAWIPKLI
jgi:hypothetical protein